MNQSDAQSEKYSPLKKCSKPFIPPQTDGMIRFSFNIGCSESKVISSDEKKANMSNKNALQGANVRTSCISLRTPTTNKHSQHQGGVMNSSIAPIGIARRMILAIVTSREIYPGNFEWIQRAKLFRGFKR